MLSSEDLALWSPDTARTRLSGYQLLVADDPAVAPAAAAGAHVQVFDCAARGTDPFGLQLVRRLGLQPCWPDDACLVASASRDDSAPFVFAPGSGGRAKCWPRAHWQELAVAPSAAGHRLAIVVGPAELERDDPRRWTWPPGTTFLAGLSPVELARAVQRAACFVGNDSGPTHLAALLGVPTVAIFGPSDPRIWAPPGQHVRIVGQLGRELDDVCVAEVLACVISDSR